MQSPAHGREICRDPALLRYPHITMHYDRPNPPPVDQTQLAERFRRFAVTEAEETSPLYHRLALAVAGDPQLLALATHARLGQPPANMLFGAVHYLLLRDPSHELADFFADLTSSPAPASHAGSAFRAFCLSRWDEIAALLQARLVQTNELRRCAYLLPAFSRVARETRRPLALIELGASAGFNLLFDRYAFRYSHEGVHVLAGKPDAAVEIDPVCRVVPGAELALAVPVVERRIGVDLNPVDLADEDAVLWLRALIWPEHADRIERFRQARTIWLREPPTLLGGDAVTALPALIGQLPDTVTPVVFHTHVLNQFSPDAAVALERVFERQSSRRAIYRFGNDFGGGTLKQYVLRLRLYLDGQMQETVLGYADGHARQIEWVAPPSVTHSNHDQHQPR